MEEKRRNPPRSERQQVRGWEARTYHIISADNQVKTSQRVALLVNYAIMIYVAMFSTGSAGKLELFGKKYKIYLHIFIYNMTYFQFACEISMQLK